MSSRFRLVLLGAALAACTSAAAPSFTDGATVLVADVAEPGWPSADVQIDSGMVLPGDRLRLHARFGGGCADHSFALIVARGLEESIPRNGRFFVAQARLAHDAMGDSCKALLSRALEFDLRILKQFAREQFGVERGTIVLDLGATKLHYVLE